MKKRLSQELVDSLEAPSGSRLLRVWDSSLPGFGVYVTQNGVRAFFVSYRVGRTERRATLGKTPPLKCHKAREIASQYIQEARLGTDPLVRMAEERGKRTLGEFWVEYVDDARARWKPRTQTDADRFWKRLIAPRLGNKRLDAITAGDIAAWHRSMRETPAQANLALRILKAAFNRAVAWEYLDASPVKVKPYPEKRRERFLSSEEFNIVFAAIAHEEELGGMELPKRIGVAEKGRRGGKGLKEAESRGICPHAAGLFRLLAFTGARLSEIMLARWGWVHWDQRCVALPDSKTGARRIPLSGPALNELLRLQALRTAGNEWIIEGAVAGEHLVNPATSWTRVRRRAYAILKERREKAGLPCPAENPFANLRIHDLRHSFASVAVAAGLGLPIIGKALGHSQTSTTERYAHLAADPVLEAANRIGAVILDAIAKHHAVVEKVGQQ